MMWPENKILIGIGKVHLLMGRLSQCCIKKSFKNLNFCILNTFHCFTIFFLHIVNLHEWFHGLIKLASIYLSDFIGWLKLCRFTWGISLVDWTSIKSKIVVIPNIVFMSYHLCCTCIYSSKYFQWNVAHFFLSMHLNDSIYLILLFHAH